MMTSLRNISGSNRGVRRKRWPIYWIWDARGRTSRKSRSVSCTV